MDIDWLKEAYRRTRKDGAVGVDGVTAEEYEQDLEAQPSKLARPREVRHVQSSACAACAYSERRLKYRDESARNSHSGGQNPPACGGHVVGSNL